MTSRYRPNYWMLLAVVFVLLAVAAGIETEYFAAWWKDTLTSEYPLIPFKQINKGIKVAQFLFGVLAIFELVAFPTFFKEAHDTFVWAGGMLRLSQGLPRRTVRITKNSLMTFLEEKSNSTDLPTILVREIADEMNREMDAVDHSLGAKMLGALSKVNVTPDTLKALTFGGFIVLTLGDVLTS